MPSTADIIDAMKFWRKRAKDDVLGRIDHTIKLFEQLERELNKEELKRLGEFTENWFNSESSFYDEIKGLIETLGRFSYHIEQEFLGSKEEEELEEEEEE